MPPAPLPPALLEEFGAQTPDPHPPPKPNPPNGDWEGETKFACIPAAGRLVPKLVGLLGSPGGEGSVGGKTLLTVVRGSEGAPRLLGGLPTGPGGKRSAFEQISTVYGHSPVCQN